MRSSSYITWSAPCASSSGVKGCSSRELAPHCHRIVDARVVLHRARAERIEAQVDAERPLRELREVPHHLELAVIGQRQILAQRAISAGTYRAVCHGRGSDWRGPPGRISKIRGTPAAGDSDARAGHEAPPRARPQARRCPPSSSTPSPSSRCTTRVPDTSVRDRRRPGCRRSASSFSTPAAGRRHVGDEFVEERCIVLEVERRRRWQPRWLARGTARD